MAEVGLFAPGVDVRVVRGEHGGVQVEVADLREVLAAGVVVELVPAADMLAEAVRRERSSVVDHAGNAVFLRPMPPPVRVLVVGAVHISAALVPMLELLGHQVVVVDPRRGFGPPGGGGAVEVVRDYPDEVFPSLGLDTRTAVVALTHDPKIDDPALEAALASPALYVGALGSRKTHARRLERLADNGLAPDVLARIHGPIGLDIGAATPAEIAVSIVAELTAAVRGRA